MCDVDTQLLCCSWFYGTPWGEGLYDQKQKAPILSKEIAVIKGALQLW